MFENTDLTAHAFTYRHGLKDAAPYLKPIAEFDKISAESLLFMDEKISLLSANTQAFVSGKSAASVLFWGARGCGKSSCMKAVFNKFLGRLKVIELDAEHLCALPYILDFVREHQERFIIFLDDLSFEPADPGYKSLKSLMDGRLEAFPKNALIYATSNLKHLLKESAITTGAFDAATDDELISLSDRFGISVGFYNLDADEFLKIIESFGVKMDAELRQKALNYATLKGSRNARIAHEFVKLRGIL